MATVTAARGLIAGANDPGTRWRVAPVLGVGIALLAWRRRALSTSGAAAAAAVGTAVFGGGGLPRAALLLLFFGSSTALSHLTPRDDRRPAQGGDRPAGPRRTAVQVLANGGIPATLALLSGVRPSPCLSAAYAGALAAANADTWATEVGAGSRTPPRLITSGRRVEPGVSGAITPRGTAGSLAGAAAVALSAALVERRPALVATITIAGFVGALADSLLGATVQAVYRCRGCALRTEDRRHRHDGLPSLLVRQRGLAPMTNDTVNLCASLVGALVAAALDDPLAQRFAAVAARRIGPHDLRPLQH